MLTVSPYRLSMFRQCAYKHYLTYVERRPKPTGPSPSAIRGRALHAGAEHDLKAVVRAMQGGAPRLGADLSLPTVQEAVAEAFDKGSAGLDEYVQDDGTITLTEGPAAEWALHGADAGKTKDLTVQGMTPEWYRSIAPRVVPADVEVSVTAPLALPDGSEVLLRGRLDVLPADGILSDLKHSAKAFGKTRYSTEADADEDDQLTAYDLLYRAATGREPRALGFDTVQLDGPRGGEPKVAGVAHPRVAPRSAEQIARYADVAMRVVQGIQAGYSAPTQKDSWWCSARWCAYHSICPHGGAPKPSAFVV